MPSVLPFLSMKKTDTHAPQNSKTKLLPFVYPPPLPAAGAPVPSAMQGLTDVQVKDTYTRQPTTRT
jgi:hypothetical protein